MGHLQRLIMCIGTLAVLLSVVADLVDDALNCWCQVGAFEPIEIPNDEDSLHKKPTESYRHGTVRPARLALLIPPYHSRPAPVVLLLPIAQQLHLPDPYNNGLGAPRLC